MGFKLLFSLLIAVFLSGCAHIYGNKGLIKSRSDNAYLNTRAGTHLKVPADLSSPAAQQDLYAVPQLVAEENPKQALSITPPGANLTSVSQKRSLWQRLTH